MGTAAQRACVSDRQPDPPELLRGAGIRYRVGLDIGSTTVKAVVIEAQTDRILWQDYQRHDTRQPEKLLEFLRRIEAEVGIAPDNCRMFITGSGGNSLSNLIGAKFVQEVNAVSLAVEKLHPEVNSVVELGGQDAKVIIFKEEGEDGRKKKIPSMNDKCAGGTGAVIDKINAKLKIPPDELCNQAYTGIKIHPVAGKCGVFAETDINGLQKQGIPPAELMASLFDAIVLQNLTVLTRGYTLRPQVLLLGGPNRFIRGMREAWQHNIPLIWKERDIELPPNVAPEDLIKTPENALYFAAMGAVEFGNGEASEIGQYLGYPIFSQSTLPLDGDLLERLFGEEVRAGIIQHPLDISDVWKTAFSASSNHKIWAAKFTARHPNLVAVEISSFKCGHDAPIYSVIEQIVERSGTPYFSFKDLDENRPTNTIKLRIETIDYFLKRYREDLLRRKQKEREIERQLAEYEHDLREQLRQEPAHLAHAS